MSATRFFYRAINNRTALLLAAALSVAVVAFSARQLWAEPRPADLSESPFALTATMLTQWQEGDVIVFVRHLERCSRVEAACLGEPSGITQRSTTTGLALREHFVGLGLAATDVYSSPLTRTSQTSALLFANPTANEDFLYQCEDLVLVTHSSCMDEVNDSLAYAEVDYAYGAAVFLQVESATEYDLLGFIDADDWSKTLVPNS